MKVKDCRIDNHYVAISPSQSVSEIVGQVRNNNFAVVCDEGKPVGILTTEDIVARLLVAKKDQNTTKVKDIMSSPVKTASMNDDLNLVSEMMVKENFLSLPVVDEDGNLAGIVTVYDVIAKLRGKI